MVGVSQMHRNTAHCFETELVLFKDSYFEKKGREKHMHANDTECHNATKLPIQNCNHLCIPSLPVRQLST